MMADLAHLWAREGIADLAKQARKIERAASACREGGHYRLTMEALARCYRAAEAAFRAQAAIELAGVPEPPPKPAIVRPSVVEVLARMDAAPDDGSF